MTKWYEEKYINRRDWILDHLESLGLSTEETMVVLLIDFLMENRVSISIELLQQKTGLSSEQIESVISTLCAKKYLEIKANAKGVRFILNGLFETNIARDENILDASLINVFESEFKRPLTNMEMEKISEWNRTIDKRMILYALREASAYQHLKFPYIDKILNDWMEKGYTIDFIESRQ